jgi:mycothiol synthase
VNVELRPLRDGDIATITEIVNRSYARDGITQVMEDAELDELVETTDAANDVRVALLDGVPVGYGLVWYDPSGERLERAFVFGTVDPEQRGKGVGRVVLRWSVDRARHLMTSVDNDLPKVIRGDVYEQVDDAHRLFTRAGFVQVRWFEDLLRPLGEPVEAIVPDGYGIESWPTDAQGADEVRELRNASFADHWGSTPWSSQRFHEIVYGHGTRLDLSVVARERASGRIVAFSLNEHLPRDEEVTGRRDGWIGVLGTAAAHRGRGLASALITESLRRFAAAGMTHAAIGVDSESQTGAHRLYRALGFEPMDRHVTYELNALSSETRF